MLRQTVTFDGYILRELGAGSQNGGNVDKSDRH
jgi:hypothetical protein